MKATSQLETLKNILGESEVPFTFLGKKAVQRMQNGNMAEVTLKTGGTCGKYEGLLLTIVNPNDGTVTTNFFSFEEYLGAKANRTHQNASHVRRMHVWADNGEYDWYIVRPTDVTPIIDAILEFIVIYGE